MAEVADDKLDNFMDNVKWTRKHANTLNEKFALHAEESQEGIVTEFRHSKAVFLSSAPYSTKVVGK